MIAPGFRRIKMFHKKSFSRLTVINLVLIALFTGTFLSPLIYTGLRSIVTRGDRGHAGPLNATEQASLITLQQGYINVYKKVSPSVVYIRTNMLVKPRFWFDYYRQVEGAGSGFIVDNEGYIVTNSHVVAGAQNIEVIFHDDTRAPATLVGRDESSDVALIKVAPSNRYVPAAFGNSDEMEPGVMVFALGAPFGLDRTFTTGIISAKQRFIDNSRYSRIQTDAAINPGNSGGPLINIYGEVVGINQSIISSNGGGNVGIGFAIPINEATKVIDQLKKEKRVIGKPALGVSVGLPSPAYREYLGLKDDLNGVVIRFIVPGSSADEAGLKENDFIMKANGKEMKSPEDLINEVQKTGVGSDIELEIIRDGKEMKIRARIGEDTAGNSP